MMPHRTSPLPRDAHRVHVIVYAFVKNVENVTWGVRDWTGSTYRTSCTDGEK